MWNLKTHTNKTLNQHWVRKEVVRVSQIFFTECNQFHTRKLQNDMSSITVSFLRREELFKFFRMRETNVRKMSKRTDASFLELRICLSCLKLQSSKGVFRKRYSENMQQIYRRTSMPKFNFNNATLCKALISIMKLYWNLTLTCSFYKNTSERSFLSIEVHKYFHIAGSEYEFDSSYDHYIRTSSSEVGSKSISFVDCLFIIYFKPLFSR